MTPSCHRVTKVSWIRPTSFDTAVAVGSIPGRVPTVHRAEKGIPIDVFAKIERRGPAPPLPDLQFPPPRPLPPPRGPTTDCLAAPTRTMDGLRASPSPPP